MKNLANFSKQVYLLSLLFCFYTLNAQEIGLDEKSWKWGGSPIMAYDPDLGLRIGAAIDWFDHGKPTVFPDYLQNFRLRAFHSTKGSSNFSLVWESEKLIPHTISFTEFTYINDSKLDFFGFNGLESHFHSEWINPESQSFRNSGFYSHRRRILRVRMDFHYKLGSGNWKLLGGLNFQDYLIRENETEEEGTNPTSTESQSSLESLLSYYKQWQLIPSNENDGGKSISMMLGFSYDSRNHRIHCTDGLWIENYLVLNRGFLEQESFIKWISTASFYKTIKQINSTFTFRVSSQQRLSGKIPFYLLPVFYDTRQNQDGIGGAFTQRGVYRNRIVGDGFILSNLEMRKRVIRMEFLGLDWQVFLSLFYDISYISQKHPTELSKVPENQLSSFFQPEGSNLISTFGIGAYFIYNENNIISVNFGYNPNIELGKPNLYIGSSFLF